MAGAVAVISVDGSGRPTAWSIGDDIIMNTFHLQGATCRRRVYGNLSYGIIEWREREVYCKDPRMEGLIDVMEQTDLALDLDGMRSECIYIYLYIYICTI